MAELAKIKTTKIYKKIIIGFSSIVILTLAFIIYYSFNNTVISLTLQPIEETTTFNVDIKEELTDEDQLSDYKLSGVFLNTIIEKTKSFENSNTGEKADAQATGTVTIYNNYTQSQPLAATTRLLDKNGILFRLKDRVDVPAGGKIENVEVYADESGINGNIEPTTFTIPGLWPGLQDKIYAQSFNAMVGGVVDAKILTQNQLTEAVSKLKNEIIEEAKQTFIQSEGVKEKDFSTIGQALAALAIESNVTPVVGEIASTFEVYVKYNIFGIIFDETKLIEMANKNMLAKLPPNRIIDEKIKQKINYNPETQNFDDKTANLVVNYIAKTKLTPANDIFNKHNLTNKTAGEINRYFSNYDGILSVNTKFSPFWATKTPNLTDHIEIKIE